MRFSNALWSVFTSRRDNVLTYFIGAGLILFLCYCYVVAKIIKDAPA